VSSTAKFDNKSAIRGGIPIVFPNFGPWSLGPQHGFARISRWQVEKLPTKDDSGNVIATFTLEDTEATRTMWNNNMFKLTYTVKLGDGQLETSLDVENRGVSDFDFTCLFHTYFQLPDITRSSVNNLEGHAYTDKVLGGARAIEDRYLVTIDQTVDRVYENTPDEHIISGVTGHHAIKIQKRNFPDTVVWNPWDKALAMTDLGSEYVNMLCVEAGHVSSRFQLMPGSKFRASQTLTVLDF
jgi:glucose-6-phosphate 1-epimerase